MARKNLRILALGAHPDDCDVKFGGTAMLYARGGHSVKFVSVTNGDTGHFSTGGGPLARRRYEEAQRAAAVAGIAYEVLDIHNGQLEPTLDNRMKIVRVIREFDPDLVVTHRPNDYHPDHRYTSQLVQDAAYTVTIPNVAALTPHLTHNPAVAYMSDDFKKPYPFMADIVISIDEVVDDKVRMLDCHESQFYEWLPYNRGVTEVPEKPAARLAWLKEDRAGKWAQTAQEYREVLRRLYGEATGSQVEYAEALEICEYGAPVSKENLHTLFPFFTG